MLITNFTVGEPDDGERVPGGAAQHPPGRDGGLVHLRVRRRRRQHGELAQAFILYLLSGPSRIKMFLVEIYATLEIKTSDWPGTIICLNSTVE